MPNIATCPAQSQLKALATGALPAEQKEPILTHLEACDSCGKAMSDLAGRDTLVDLIRQGDTQTGEGENEDLKKWMTQFEGYHQGAIMNKPDVEPATLACDGCQKKLKVKPELRGKKVKCPGCGKLLAVPPAPTPTDDRTVPPASRQDDATVAPSGPQMNQHDTPAVDRAGASQSRDEAIDFLAPAQNPDEIGRLGSYRVLKVLGKGGMGVVFLAEDPQLRRKVALKAMLPTLAVSESARKRFLREAQTAASIEHDHIVPIFQVGEDRGVPYIAMPFLKGQPLDVRIETEPPLSIAETLRIGRETALGLEAAHAQGLIHRDIKPANIWLEAPTQRVKILDFGLARAADDSGNLTQQGAIVGTPAFMAPEQASGLPVDGRCDLFSLGCVLYRLATGKNPFRGNDTISTLMAVAIETPAAPSKVNGAVPEKLSELIVQLLAKKADDRPATARAVVEAIQTIEHDVTATANLSKGDLTVRLKDAGGPGGAPHEEKAKAPPRRRSYVLAGIFGLLAILVAGVFVIRLQNNDGEFIVEVEDDSVTVALDKLGDLKLVDKKSGKEYSVKSQKMPTGEYELRVNDTAAGLEFSARTFAINSKDAARVRVSFKKKDEGVAKAKTPPSFGDYALQFDGNASAYVNMSQNAKLDDGKPFTIEVWAKPTQRKETKGLLQAVVFSLGKVGIDVSYSKARKYSWRASHGSGPGVTRIDSAAPSELNRPERLAVTSDGETLRFFVDGKLSDSAPLSATKRQNAKIEIGNDFIGQIDDVRISTVCRYTADYTPLRPTKDADTLALYHFDEGQGDVLVDSSGNGHHGKIEGAKWVQVTPSLPLGDNTNFALSFKNSTPAITIPFPTKIESKEHTMEFLLEVKVVNSSRRILKAGNHTIHCSHENLSFGNVNIPKLPLTKEPGWKHVALVTSVSGRKVFLDGKKVIDSPSPGVLTSIDEIIIGENNVVFNIDEIRISTKARYVADFLPARHHEPDADTVALYHCDENSGDKLIDSSGNGHHGKIEGAKWVPTGPVTPPVPGGYALEFSEDANVNARWHIGKLDFRQPFTIEAWAKPAKVNGNRSVVHLSTHFGLGIITGVEKPNLWYSTLGSANYDTARAYSQAQAKVNQGVRLAVTSDGKAVRLFVDGKLAEAVPFPEKLPPNVFGSPLSIGGTILNNRFHGLIDDVRISTVCRYTADYTPARPEKDKDTLALYRFDEGQGDVLTDSSGNGHHGKIEGAKWVKVEGTPNPTSTALGFEAVSYLGVDQQLLVAYETLTLEGWFWLTQEGSSWNSDLITSKGVKGPKLRYEKENRQFGYNKGGTTGIFGPAVFERWTHVAGVQSGKVSRLFIDGKLAAENLKTAVANLDSIERILLRGGMLKEIRISKSARYEKDFVPQTRFAPDADTVALYHCDEGQGDVAADSSGNGYHGKIFRPKWVKGDGTPTTAASGPARYALDFDGIGAAKLVRAINLTEKPFTVEAWVKPGSSTDSQQPIRINSYSQNGLYITNTKKEAARWGTGVNLAESLYSTVQAVQGQAVRAAISYDGETLRLFIDGKLAGSGPVAKSKTLFNKFELGRNFVGQLSEIRISTVSRYAADYVPGPLEKDANTLALYRFDEGEGDLLKDSSGNGYDIKIEGAKWVKVGFASPSLLPTSSSSPFDQLRREDIPADLLKGAESAPTELVAILGAVSGEAQPQYYQLAVSPDGRRIYANYSKNTYMQAWDIPSGKEIPEWRHPAARALVLSPDGKLLVHAASGKTGIHLWNTDTVLDKGIVGKTSVSGPTLALHPDGSEFAFSPLGANTTISVANLATGVERVRYEGHAGNIWLTRYSPDGQWLAVHCMGSKELETGSLKVWNTQSGKPAFEIATASAYGSQVVAFGPDSSWIAVRLPKEIALLDSATGAEKLKFDLRDNLSSLAVSPDGKRIVGASSKRLLVWDATTGEKQFDFALTGSPRRVAFSPDSRHVVTANDEGTLYVFRLAAFMKPPAVPVELIPPPTKSVPLFNGKDLTGFAPTKNWTVDQGTLVGGPTRNFAESLRTADEFGDFELSFRMRYPLTEVPNGKQPTFNFRPVKNNVRGALQFLPDQIKLASYGGQLANHKGVAPRKDDFNDVWIRCVGPRMKVVINGELLVDADLVFGSNGIFHWNSGEAGGVVLRDIRVVPLTKPTPAGVELFNGKDLTGFNDASKSWKVVDGTLQGARVGSAKATANELNSLAQFTDFDLSFRVQCPVPSSSGASTHPRFAFRHGDKSAGVHFGINSIKATIGKTVPYRTGKDEFNDVSIRCVGKHVKIVVNGETLADGEFDLEPSGHFSWTPGSDGEMILKDIRVIDLAPPAPIPPQSSLGRDGVIAIPNLDHSRVAHVTISGKYPV